MTQAPFADAHDYEVCRRLHRHFGTTYYFATLRFPAHIRRRVHAVYGFVRVPDEWVDNPGSLTLDERRALLEGWRAQLHQGLIGVRPEHPAMRAFVDVALECSIPLEEADCFIDAMETDLTKDRYETYEELRGYMRGSAMAVGAMMCFAMDAKPDAFTLARAHALGEAMQLTNFIRDVAEDAGRGRIYLPLEDMAAYGITESQILEKRFSPELRELMRFEICRAKTLYCHSDMGLPHLPEQMRNAVILARLLYAKILDKVEEQGHDPFAGRARTTLREKLLCAASVLMNPKGTLEQLVAEPEGLHSPVLSMSLGSSRRRR